MNLFPEITPHKTHILQVDDIHKIYIEQSGQPDGIPVIFLHGGISSNARSLTRRAQSLENFYRSPC